MWVFDGGRDYRIGKNQKQHWHVEIRRSSDPLQGDGELAISLVFIDGDELQAVLGPLEYLAVIQLCVQLFGAPHLLELDSYLGEGLDYNGDKHVFNKPGKEENHWNKIEEGSPGGQTVRGTVHEKYPALLWRCFVYGEYTCDFKEAQNHIRYY